MVLQPTKYTNCLSKLFEYVFLYPNPYIKLQKSEYSSTRKGKLAKISCPKVSSDVYSKLYREQTVEDFIRTFTSLVHLYVHSYYKDFVLIQKLSSPIPRNQVLPSFVYCILSCHCFSLMRGSTNFSAKAQYCFVLIAIYLLNLFVSSYLGRKLFTVFYLLSYYYFQKYLLI